jgi:hypothetical protein
MAPYAYISNSGGAQRLGSLKLHDSDLLYERNNLCDAFDDLAADDSATLEQFNTLMRDLYDFGDIEVSGERLCWIRTAY